MPGYIEGLSLGARIAQAGTEKDMRQQQFQAELAERAKEDQLREAGAKAESAYKSRELDIDAQKLKQEADYKAKELEERQARDKAEERHWKTLEDIAGQRIGRGAGGGGNHDLTPSQAGAEVDRILKMTGGTDPTDQAMFDRLEYAKSKATPGYAPRTFQAKEAHPWLQKLLAIPGSVAGGFMSGYDSETKGGSSDNLADKYGTP